ncbi:hypothetical protein IPJ91_01460 [bacterium]|nr:MAG: hypothetical protein IPJ91_01460 [bacterium]
MAQSVNDLDTKLIEKQSELNSLSTSLDELTNAINTISTSTNITQGELNAIDKQVNEFQSLVNAKISEIDALNQEIIYKENEIRDKLNQVNFKINKIYKLSKITAKESLYFDLKVSPNSQYTKNLIYTDINYVNQASIEIDKIKSLVSSSEEIKSKLMSTIVDLNKKRDEISVKLANIKAQLNLQSQTRYQVISQINSLNKDILNITEEQKRIQKEEAEKLSQPAPIPIDVQTFVNGEIYFSGRGRDLYDGHGVGMSQWGAYGAGIEGFTAHQILQKYYTGISIEKYNANFEVTVPGYGTMDVETYLAGIGEVPSTACDANQANGSWNCWPKETIKAQVIAARTYVIAHLQKVGSGATVSNGPDFQVYVGGNAKAWAVEETSKEVIKYNGGLVTAVYSASHQGQSENNELVFTRASVATTKEGLVGTPYPYLRSVNDSAFAYRNQTYNFSWNTIAFTKAKIGEIFQTLGNIDIGNLQQIEIFTGGSNRVWAVGLIGDKSKKYVAGWRFKSEINDYIFENYPESQRSYLYSTEFRLVEVQN